MEPLRVIKESPNALVKIKRGSVQNHSKHPFGGSPVPHLYLKISSI